MYYAVEQTESTFAVLTDDEENTREVPLSALPDGIRQGDILWEENGVFRADPAEKARRQARIRDLERRLGRR